MFMLFRQFTFSLDKRERFRYFHAHQNNIMINEFTITNHLERRISILFIQPKRYYTFQVLLLMIFQEQKC